jgi:hypothetical protein
MSNAQSVILNSQWYFLPLDTERDSLYQEGEGKWRISLKNKMPDELKNEITTYLTEVKADLDNYLTWAMSEVSMGSDTGKAAEVVEDTIHRLMTIAYYLATFFEDADPSLILADLASEVSEEHGTDPNFLSGRNAMADPPNRTRH